jgi:hypothetical protein
MEVDVARVTQQVVQLLLEKLIRQMPEQEVRITITEKELVERWKGAEIMFEQTQDALNREFYFRVYLRNPEPQKQTIRVEAQLLPEQRDK